MIVSLSRTPVPLHPDSSNDDAVLSIRDSFEDLGVVFDRKLTFEEHIHKISSSASQKVGIFHKCSRMFGDEAIMSKCFNSFLLPCLEYYSPVWSSAADSHLRLLDRVMSSVKFLLPNLSTDLWHRCRVRSLCLLHKIYCNNKHPLCSSLSDLAVFACNTRRAATANSIPFSSVTLWSFQISKIFKREQIHSCDLLLVTDSYFYLIVLSPFPFPLF